MALFCILEIVSIFVMIGLVQVGCCQLPDFPVIVYVSAGYAMVGPTCVQCYCILFNVKYYIWWYPPNVCNLSEELLSYL